MPGRLLYTDRPCENSWTERGWNYAWKREERERERERERKEERWEHGKDCRDLHNLSSTGVRITRGYIFRKKKYQDGWQWPE